MLIYMSCIYSMHNAHTQNSVTTVMFRVGRLSLDDKVAPIVDPYFAKYGYGRAKDGSNLTLARLFGPEAENITIRQLATMRAGVPDFDTAKPNETGWCNFSTIQPALHRHVSFSLTVLWPHYYHIYIYIYIYTYIYLQL